jgi:hypothetical protein
MYCISCGKFLPDNSTTCGFCGSPVLGQTANENVSCELTSLPEHGFGPKSRFDVFFTDRRVVVICMGAGQVAGAMVGGLIGKSLAKRSENKSREKMRANLSLDQMVAGNPMENFAVPYDKVESIVVSPASLIKQGDLEIRYGSDKKKFWIKKDHYNLLKNSLPTITNLSVKVQVK